MQKTQMIFCSSISEKVTTGEVITLKLLVNIVTQLKIVSTITENSRSHLTQSPR